MRQINHRANERRDDEDIVADQNLADRRIFDGVLRQLLVDRSDDSRLAPGKSGYIGTSHKAAFFGGTRQAGLTFRMSSGTGFKNIFSGDELASFRPIYAPAIYSRTLAPSHATFDRVDRIYNRPLFREDTPGSNALRDFIDTETLVISQLEVFTRSDYYHNPVVSRGVEDGSMTPGPPPSGYTDDDAIAEIVVRAGSGSFAVSDLDDLRTIIGPSFAGGQALDILVASGLIPEANVETALVRLRLENDASIIHADAISQASLNNGRLQWQSTTRARLKAHGSDDLIITTSSGRILRQVGGILDFDIPGDVLPGDLPITNDRVHHLYVKDPGSLIPAPFISKTNPLSSGAHPDEANSRYVGSLYIDIAGNLVEFDTVNEKTIFRQAVSSQSMGLTMPAAFSATAISAKYTSEARALFLVADVTGQDARVRYSQSSNAGLGPADVPPLAMLNLRTPEGTTDTNKSAAFWLPIDPGEGTPKIAWMVQETTSGTPTPGILSHSLFVMGWEI